MTLTFKLRRWLWQQLAGSSQGALEKSLQQRAAAASRCCWGCLGRRVSLVLTLVLFPFLLCSQKTRGPWFNFCVSTASEFCSCVQQSTKACAGLTYQTPLAEHRARVDGLCLNNWSSEEWDNRAQLPKIAAQCVCTDPLRDQKFVLGNAQLCWKKLAFIYLFLTRGQALKAASRAFRRTSGS